MLMEFCVTDLCPAGLCPIGLFLIAEWIVLSLCWHCLWDSKRKLDKASQEWKDFKCLFIVVLVGHMIFTYASCYLGTGEGTTLNEDNEGKVCPFNFWWSDKPTAHVNSDFGPASEGVVLGFGIFLANIIAFLTAEKLDFVAWLNEGVEDFHLAEKQWGCLAAWGVALIDLLDIVFLICSCKEYIYGGHWIGAYTGWFAVLIVDELIDVALIAEKAALKEEEKKQCLLA